MAASAEGNRFSLCARRSHRPFVEHHCYGRVGRAQAAGRAFPTHWQRERAGALGIARVVAICESDWHGAHRKAAPAIYGFHNKRNDAAQAGIVDFARSGAALRNRVGQFGADSNLRAGKLDVEGEEDSHSRRRAFEDPAFDAILPAAQRYGPVSRGVRRIPENKNGGLTGRHTYSAVKAIFSASRTRHTSEPLAPTKLLNLRG